MPGGADSIRHTGAGVKLKLSKGDVKIVRLSNKG